MADRAHSIVVIDDYPDHLRFIATLLERAGYDVAGFPDGETALARIERIAPHLVVTDIFMPGIDGFEVLRQVKQRLPNVPVVAMSGKISGHGMLYLDSIRMLGAVAAFAKPIRGRDLVVAIGDALGRPALANG